GAEVHGIQPARLHDVIRHGRHRRGGQDDREHRKTGKNRGARHAATITGSVRLIPAATAGVPGSGGASRLLPVRLDPWPGDEEIALAGVGGEALIDDALHFAEEFVHGGELAVDAGEAHVGDLVELAQAAHDRLADPGDGHFLLEDALRLVLHLLGQALEGGLGHGTLVAGALEAGDDLLAIPRHAPAVLLDDREFHALLDAFVGGEAFLAAQALPAASNGGAGVGAARINHLELILVGPAERAVHGKGAYTRCWGDARGDQHQGPVE